MSKRYVLMGLLALILVVSACATETAPTDTPLPPTQPAPPTAGPPVAEEGLFISEMLPGVYGVDNNLEFIELYNAGSTPVDLNGWSLWYRLDDNKEEQLVYAWEERTDVPGHGHYLLAQAGKDVGNIGDAQYEIALFEKKGGLALRAPNGETADALVWGEGPTGYVTGSPAPAPDGGASLERLPGGNNGNGCNSGDNATDFVLSPNPTPDNSGDPVSPLPDERLAIQLSFPASVEPGSEVAYAVKIENLTRQAVHDVRALLPLPPYFEVVSTPEGGSPAGDSLEWIIPEIAAGASATGIFTLQSPWTYVTSLIRGYYVEASDWQGQAYGPVGQLAVAGGSIPIGTARTLTGKTVTVEGVATMYTGGYYAGTTGTKFYLEDDTGGIQAYCPGAMDLVEVSVGDRVRVTGLIEVYRDSMEIIPGAYPDDVEILERSGEEPQPAPTSLKASTSDEDLLGRLIEVEGLATRVEEFSYSYEVDLVDDEGNILLAYIEKETGVTTEPLDVGRVYRVTGISEIYDGTWQIKPRFQTDLVEVFAAELMLEQRARNSVLPGETITYTLRAYNHTDAPLTNVQIVAAPPAEGVAAIEVLDGGHQEGPTIYWTIPELAGEGGSAAVRYLAVVDEQAIGPIVADGAVADADQWPDAVETAPVLTFVGSGVPIWAIQGAGMISPYTRDQAATEGVVIGVFPDLGGFWIQEIETDDDPATSAGLFVLCGELEISVELGDKVQISGKVRELSGQTMLSIEDLEAVTVVSTGNDLPQPFELDPPADEEEARVYYEAIEGMLVQVSGPAVAVGPTSGYGETVLVRADHGIERIMKGDPKGMMIFVDDGSNATHYDLSTLPFAIQTGDTVSGVRGPLAYTYENYKIEPIAAPKIVTGDVSQPTVEPAGADEFSIASFNAENLFDFSDPHPSDPPLPTRSQYNLDLTKMADAIVAMGAPTILGLQEVEQIDILTDLAHQEAIIQYDYQPFLIEGSDSRGIDVAYMVRGDQATVEGAAAFPAPEGLTSRPPLLITTTVHLESGDATVYLLNNHFLSMSGGEQPTEPRRKAQAAWNVTLVERILADKPEAFVVVLGDLNSFYDSPPLDLLREAGLRHVYEFVEPDRPYSYIYEGESETLDHILVTESLYEHLVRMEVLHINADYPPPDPVDASARGVSDHDPPIAVFRIK